MCEFFNHFGYTAIFFEVHNFCEFLKEHIDRGQNKLLLIFEKKTKIPRLASK